MEKEVGGLDVGVEGGGRFAVGLRVGEEATVCALMGERGLDPAPRVVSGHEVTGNDGGDDAPATAALGAGLNPAAVGAVVPRESFGVGDIAGAQGRESAGRKGAEDIIFAQRGARRGRRGGECGNGQATGEGGEEQ